MRLLGLFATMAAVLLMSKSAPAENGTAGCGAPGCCAQCGCQASCQKKACQVVCDTKKEKKTRWVVKCEDFCAPLPTMHKGCDCGCGGACGSCQGTAGCQSCAKGGKCCSACKEKTLVPPKCGKVRTKKTLVKEEYEVEVPVYKCVVRYLCGDCCAQGAAGDCGAKAPAAPAPKPTPAPTPARTY